MENSITLANKFPQLEIFVFDLNEDVSDEHDIEKMTQEYMDGHLEHGRTEYLINLIRDIDNLLATYTEESDILHVLHKLGLNLALNKHNRASSSIPSVWLRDVKKRAEAKLNTV